MGDTSNIIVYLVVFVRVFLIVCFVGVLFCVCACFLIMCAYMRMLSGLHLTPSRLVYLCPKSDFGNLAHTVLCDSAQIPSGVPLPSIRFVYLFCLPLPLPVL